MEYFLSKDQINQYKTEGFLCPLNVLSPLELTYYQSQWAYLRDKLPAHQKVVRGPYMFKNIKWIYDLATHPAILDAVESVLGKDILIVGGLILSKPADASSFVSWHQDAHYSTFLNDSEALTGWLALTPSNIQNGCMRVIPGTQHKNFEHVEVMDDKNLLAVGQTVMNVKSEEAVDLELNPGQMSLHHFNILHSSNFNTTNSIRTGFIVRYCTPQIGHNPYGALIHARGKKSYPHLKLITKSPTISIEEGIKMQIKEDKDIISNSERLRGKN